MVITESQNLTIYKKLLYRFDEYLSAHPMSGLSKVLDGYMSVGKKCVPSDKIAKDIIEFCLGLGSEAESVQYFLNRRFDDLPGSIKPTYKDGNKICVAYWKKGEDVSDRIKDLLSVGEEGAGKWTSLTGEKITLIEE